MQDTLGLRAYGLGGLYRDGLRGLYETEDILLSAWRLLRGESKCGFFIAVELSSRSARAAMTLGSSWSMFLPDILSFEVIWVFD